MFTLFQSTLDSFSKQKFNTCQFAIIQSKSTQHQITADNWWFKTQNTDTVKYWKYQYISIKFWILSISINISRTSVKSPSISIWRIKQYFLYNLYISKYYSLYEVPVKKNSIASCQPFKPTLSYRFSRFKLLGLLHI